LNKNTITKQVKPKQTSFEAVLKFKELNKYFISIKFNDPLSPKIIELPYNNKPFEIPPNTKYFIADSIATLL
jgi:hypothetical protein